MNFRDMAKVVPEGEKGDAKVKHYTISEREAQASRLRMMATGGREQAANVGTFAQLFVGGQLVMSDTDMERDTNRSFVGGARGKVLVAGLGLGLILLPVLRKAKVEHVTVVELSQDVINLVEPHVRRAAGNAAAEKLAVIQADIFDWKAPKGARYDVIYFDIWPTLCTTNLKEMTRLHRKFGCRKAKGGWMDSWGRYDLLRMQGRGW
jgi:hypothetical protein